MTPKKLFPPEPAHGSEIPTSVKVTDLTPRYHTSSRRSYSPEPTHGNEIPTSVKVTDLTPRHHTSSRRGCNLFATTKSTVCRPKHYSTASYLSIRTTHHYARLLKERLAYQSTQSVINIPHIVAFHAVVSGYANDVHRSFAYPETHEPEAGDPIEAGERGKAARRNKPYI